MPLHLIAMLVHAAEEVRAAMHIQHDAIALRYSQLFARIMVLAHLYPLRLHRRAVPPPLPPVLPADCFDATWAKLRADEFSRSRELRIAYIGHFHVHPVRYWDPLRREGLQLVDGVQGRVVQEAPDELEALVVGDVCGGLLCKWSAIEVVGEIGLDHSGCDCRADRNRVDRHCVFGGVLSKMRRFRALLSTRRHRTFRASKEKNMIMKKRQVLAYTRMSRTRAIGGKGGWRDCIWGNKVVQMENDRQDGPGE